MEGKKNEKEGWAAWAYGVAEFGAELLDDEGEGAGNLVEHGVGESPMGLGRDLPLSHVNRQLQLQERVHLLRVRKNRRHPHSIHLSPISSSLLYVILFLRYFRGHGRLYVYIYIMKKKIKKGREGSGHRMCHVRDASFLTGKRVFCFPFFLKKIIINFLKNITRHFDD